MSSNEKEVKRLIENIVELVRKEGFAPQIFKGKIKKKVKEEVIVKIFEKSDIKALLFHIGTPKNNGKFEANVGDDVIVFKTENAGNLAISLVLNDTEPTGMRFIAENIVLERRSGKIYIGVDNISVFETIIKDFEKIKEGLEKAKAGFEAIKSTSASASIEPVLKAVGEAVSPAIEGLAQAISGIAELNNTIKKISL
jgi:hypothetical protein